MSPLPRWERSRVRVIGDGRRAGLPPLAGKWQSQRGKPSPSRSEGDAGAKRQQGVPGAEGRNVSNLPYCYQHTHNNIAIPI